MSEPSPTPEEPGDDAEVAGGARHRAREVALQVLYAVDLGGHPEEGFDRDAVFDRVSENFDVPESVSSFARELVRCVVERASDLDELIGAHARNWRVSRMAAVDRNVLRIAVYELRDTETPVAVVIDEAVDLARRFGSDPSPAFVNGVLDAIAREVRAS